MKLFTTVISCSCDQNFLVIWGARHGHPEKSFIKLLHQLGKWYLNCQVLESISFVLVYTVQFAMKILPYHHLWHPQPRSILNYQLASTIKKDSTNWLDGCVVKLYFFRKCRFGSPGSWVSFEHCWYCAVKLVITCVLCAFFWLTITSLSPLNSGQSKVVELEWQDLSWHLMALGSGLGLVLILPNLLLVRDHSGIHHASGHFPHFQQGDYFPYWLQGKQGAPPSSHLFSTHASSVELQLVHLTFLCFFGGAFFWHTELGNGSWWVLWRINKLIGFFNVAFMVSLHVSNDVIERKFMILQKNLSYS